MNTDNGFAAKALRGEGRNLVRLVFRTNCLSGQLLKVINSIDCHSAFIAESIFEIPAFAGMTDYLEISPCSLWFRSNKTESFANAS
jgi:hypothetical protein